MSHWHRAPRAISVRSLVQRCAKCIFLDRTVELPVRDLKTLSKDVEAICEMDPEGRLSLTQIARLCQEMHGLLVTTEVQVIPMLIVESSAPWGVMLVPHERAAQTDALQRLTTDQLVVRPSVDQESIAEFARQNRLLIELSQSSPSIGVFSNCRWSHPKQ